MEDLSLFSEDMEFMSSKSDTISRSRKCKKCIISNVNDPQALRFEVIHQRQNKIQKAKHCKRSKCMTM